MGASPTPRSAEPRCFGVACSGGPDSLALLHAAARAAAVLGLRVLALHVHHGLMPEADAWQVRLAAQCRRWAARGLPVRLVQRRLAGAPAAGDSVEAWARRGRYAALADMAAAEGVALVLLAHHRRDQAETVLLQALRGAGPAGLAAMPRQVQRGGITWARPWLAQPAQAVAAYLRRHRLKPVQDESNLDERYARGRLRTGVWPALLGAFPDAEQALALAAQRAHEADAALREWVAQDLAAVAAEGGALQLAAWRALPPARAALLLRAWLDTRLPHGAPQALVQRLAADLPRVGQGRWPAGHGWQCTLYRQVLRCEAPPAAAGPVVALDLSHPGTHPVPGWGGAIRVRAVATGGLPAALLQQCLARPRAAGDRIALPPGGLARSLKKQYQARGVPAWWRGGPVLQGPQGQLLYVPGLGADTRALAPAGELACELSWLPGGAA